MKMRHVFATMLLASLSVNVFAQGPTFPRDITFTVTAPSNYVDGSTILPTDGLTIDITCTRNDGTVVLDRAPFTNPFNPGESVTQGFVDAIPNSGTYTCQAFAVVDGISSDPSNDAVKRYTGQPGPPVIVVVSE